ncbi:MAG: hypothetical protein JWM31_3408 [Solirubrobacterales bacterium]|nr:hypothetical protein [Solirubrobacterales bacterium]
MSYRHEPGQATGAFRRLAGAVAAAALFAGLPETAHAAQPPVGLGTSAPFATLAGSTVTNTGPSVVNGDLGLSPGTAVTGFGGPGDGTINGAIHIADSVAVTAKADLDNAYKDAAGRTPAAALAADLGSSGSLGPGVYKATSALQLTGPVTLDAGGDASAIFIFQVGTALTTGSASSVNLINGAQPCNVFWQVGSSATLGSGSTFVGTILADQSISVNNGVTIQGRTLARTAAVTLINDTITRSDCATPTSSPSPSPSPSSSPTPSPSPSPSPTSSPTPTPTPTPDPSSAPTPSPPPAPAPAPAPSPTPTSPAPAPAPAPAPEPSPLNASLSPTSATFPAPAPSPTPANTATAPATTSGNFFTPPQPPTAASSGGSAYLTVSDTQALVIGHNIASVVFRLDGRVIRPSKHSPLRVPMIMRPGPHTVTARITFTTGRPSLTRTRRWTAGKKTHPTARPALSRPPKTNGGFTG